MGKPISIIAGYFNDEMASDSLFVDARSGRRISGEKIGIFVLSEFEDYAIKSGMNYVKLEVGSIILRLKNCTTNLDIK